MATCGALVASLTTGCWAEPSAMPAVRDFLIAWQVGNYPAAAKKTVGADRKQVESALGQVRAQLDAASLRLALGVPTEGDTKVKAIRKTGDDATASFSVKVDLGENGQPWTYKGSMRLRREGGKWKVVWDPSIINPALKPGQRLAVKTTVPPRALIKDGAGRSLLREVSVYAVGVYPGHLADTQRTLDGLAKQVKLGIGQRLDTERLLGRVRSAPPQEFLPLMTLEAGEHQALLTRLNQVPGLKFMKLPRVPIQPKAAPELVGGLGPATADRLQQVGAPYQPGDTIGVNGIQLLQQRRLAGTPTVKVVAQDPAGRVSQELAGWEGQQPQEVDTTLDASFQVRADKALAGLTVPASLVAVRPSTGEVIAVANHGTGGKNLAFEAEYPPGMTFGIVSAEALISKAGLNQASPTTCPGTITVGGRTFTSKARAEGNFATHFGFACQTTFAQLSGKLDVPTLMTEAAGLGLGKDWGLSVPAFTGSIPKPANDAEKAAIMVGEGGVRVSPLAMAMVAGAARYGTWRAPYVLKGLTDPSLTPPAQNLPRETISSLRALTTQSMRSLLAKDARVSNDVTGIAAVPTYKDKDRERVVSWFVGSRGDLAFAVAIEGKVYASRVARTFLSRTPPVATTTKQNPR
ncbi:penicillin-binding transpeptidase domain-containing protein [Actinomadura roseirufa]|uniref:penicillin-binding transpeptidase domain-containing protein n=1 Tax=Actinomadura roseirufa TaxID=2094049 RepID=UPI0010410C0C|nr:penicillin-binding transpeptidase domain-containing protein [Actinomadura roseirufa]